MDGRTDLLRALRAGWWGLPIVLVVALGSAALLNSVGEERASYRAEATLAVVPDSSIEERDQVLRSIEVLERRATLATLSRIPRSTGVRERAARRAGLSLRELRPYRVETNIMPSTHLIRVTVEGPEPEVAARFADAVAATAKEEGTGYYRVFSLRVLDGAAVPDHPVDRGERRIYVVAGLLGLLLGLGAALGMGLLRSS